MNRNIIRIIVLGFLFSIIASPSVAYHLGPPAEANGKETAVYGCTCHGVGGTDNPLIGQ